MAEKKEKSFEKRQELISAAAIEFSKKGYESASLNNILKEAGISKGTFYYHFKNKEDLYMYIIRIFINEKKKFLEENIKPEEFNKDIFELLGVFTKAGMKFANSNPHISNFSQSLIKEQNRKMYNKVLKDFGHEADDYMENLIEGAYAKGELREDLPKDFVKRLVAYLFTHIPDITHSDKVDDYGVAINNLVKFLKDGLGKK